ncbi:unnamed protein product [Rotaria sordida]|uniref:Zinc finger RNA-binding protein n=1 Tax=Rotaria sordida TaxID=392033 RepID=A0A819DIX2_9BILA|nr:unnamed protein product [Rotaria sordida]
MHNSLSYSQTVQQQSLYAQQFPNTLSQPRMPQYGNYPMYSSIQTQQPYIGYNHQNQSTTETLTTFTRPPEPLMANQHSSNISQQNLNHRSGNNLKNATNSTRVYYCETCRIACGGHASYQEHLNGSKHKKKEMNSLNQQTNQNTFRCDLCDITCTSSDAYKAHLDGSKHDKALKLHLKLGKTIPQNINQPLVSINESQTVINNEEKQSNENSINLVGLEYIEISYDNTNTPRSYYCKLCDCKFNDSNTKDAHLKGKRHRLSYKKKVNPSFQVDNNNNNNKLLSPKHNTNENMNDQQMINNNNNNNNPIDIDDDTKCLMKLHEQIIPTQNLLNTIEQFVSAVETALKSCSDQLCPSQPSTIDNTSKTSITKSPLLGVSRIGALVKKLLIKSDRLFYIVVICEEWPTMNLFEKIFSILPDNFHETWKNQINIQCQKADETIQVYTNTIEGQMSVLISFTSSSSSIQQQQHSQTSEELLTKTNCLNALYAMHSVQWFQSHISTRQHASALIRCLRYKTKTSLNWQSLSSEAIEILIEHTLSKSVSAVCAFRRVLEYLAGGLFLSSLFSFIILLSLLYGPGLRIPWETDSINNIFDKLNDQERNDITHEAQIGLRFMAFGQLNKWFEQYDIPKVMKSFQKRSYTDHENQVSVKRQCLESENIEEQ